MTENAYARVTRVEAAALAGRSVRQINRWMKDGKVSVEYEKRGGQVYATLDPTEVLAAAGKPCVCRRPDLLGAHRWDSPCYVPDYREGS